MNTTAKKRARLRIAIAVLCGLQVAAPAIDAADPRPRLPVPVDNQRAAARGLAPFLERLATAVRDRDAAFVRAHLDPGFACFRDFGGVCDEGPGTGAENFERLFDLDDKETDPEYAGWGWRRLGGLVVALTVGPVSENDMLNGEAAGKGLLCGPAPPAPAALKAVERFAGEDYWFLWAFVEGAGVRLRAGPSTDAPVLGRLSFEAAELTERDARPGSGAPEGWVSVVGPGGAEGWVAGRFVRSFVAARLCYGRGADGGWRIAAHIGGGD